MKTASTNRGLGRRRHNLVRLGLISLGWVLVLLGFLGGLVPALPGWPLGVAGALIVYLESRWVRRKVRRWRHRHPRVEKAWVKVRAWMRDRKRLRRRRDQGPAS